MSEAVNENNAMIEGRVTFENEEPLPGVVVTLSGDGHAPREAVTDADGMYRFIDVAVGRYSLKAQLEGLHTVDCPAVDVHPGANVVNIMMAPDAVEA